MDSYETPIYNDVQQPEPKKSKVGLLVGIIIAVLLVVAGFFGYNFLMSKKAQKKGEELINTFLTAYQEADPQKLVSVTDPESNEMQGNDMIDKLAVTFQLFSAMGVQYTVDYTILDSRKATKDEVEDMCITYFGDASRVKEIKWPYVYDVSMTMTFTYDGQTQSSTENNKIICYKRDGHYYLGGAIE